MTRRRRSCDGPRGPSSGRRRCRSLRTRASRRAEDRDPVPIFVRATLDGFRGGYPALATEPSRSARRAPTKPVAARPSRGAASPLARRDRRARPTGDRRESAAVHADMIATSGIPSTKLDDLAPPLAPAEVDRLADEIAEVASLIDAAAHRLLIACSGPSRTAIPADVGHRFRSMSDSDSGPSRTLDRGRVSGSTRSAEP